MAEAATSGLGAERRDAEVGSGPGSLGGGPTVAGSMDRIKQTGGSAGPMNGEREELTLIA